MNTWRRILLKERSAPDRYGVAALLALAFLALAYGMSQLEDTRLATITIISVVLSAVYGGMGPALAAALLSALGLNYLFEGSLAGLFGSWTSLLRIATFAAVGAIVASIVTALRSAYHDLHAQYRQTEEAKRARETMLAIVSHDLRSPLSAVVLGAGFLKDAAAKGRPLADLGRVLDTVERSAQAMKRLVDDLLDAARIESGRFHIEPALQPLAPIVRDAVQTWRLAAAAQGIRFELDLPAGEHAVHCDRQRIAQVLANLIGNAVKFSPPGAEVLVRLAVERDWLRVDVVDRGPGIKDADLPHVFSRYWQAEGVQVGAGLGLFIAKSIVDAHGGRLEVASLVGKGSTFAVRLPRRPLSRPA